MEFVSLILKGFRRYRRYRIACHLHFVAYKAFQQQVLWGLAYLFIPFAGLVYVIKYWDNAKMPFIRALIASLIACVLIIAAAALAPGAVGPATY